MNGRNAMLPARPTSEAKSAAVRPTAALVVAAIATAMLLGGCMSIDTSSDLDQFVHKRMERAEIPGMAVGIMTGGQLVDVRSYGYADVQTGRLVEDSTIFMIASISKTVTATALMVLEDRGELELDDDINDYLPFAVTHPAFPDAPITFRMLLTHTAGIEDNWDVYDALYTIDSGGGDSPVSLDRLIRGYYVPGGEYYDAEANFHPAEPGTSYEYSNMGYALVGYLVQVIGRADFREFCASEVFAPLGMNRTAWSITDLDPEEVAVPHIVTRFGTAPIGHYGFASYPDGQLRTTVGDYARFLQLFMGTASAAILSDDAVDEVLRIQFPEVDEWQAIAWNYDEFGNRAIYERIPHLPGHTGGDPGVVTMAVFDPESGNGVIVFANGGRPTTRAIKAFYYDLLLRLCWEAGIGSPQM